MIVGLVSAMMVCTDIVVSDYNVMAMAYPKLVVVSGIGGCSGGGEMKLGDAFLGRHIFLACGRVKRWKLTRCGNDIDK